MQSVFTKMPAAKEIKVSKEDTSGREAGLVCHFCGRKNRNGYELSYGQKLRDVILALASGTIGEKDFPFPLQS